MNLYLQFSSVIQRYIKPHSRLVLAFSGGVDSRVMLELLAEYQRQYKVSCLAVHVHHGLSDNADNWAQQCKVWAEQLNVDFRLEKVSLELERRSLEECAREARYQALSAHLQVDDLLLTGQHGDDQLETFLLALKRGSGPKGLSAMAEAKAFSSGTLVRPLLAIKRSEIEEYAQQRGLGWVEDESNQDTRFDRNFIRHQVSPVLVERWPHFSQAVQRSTQLCAEQEALLDELMSEKFKSLCNGDGSLSIDGMIAVSALMRSRLIRMWLATHHARMPSREHVEKIWLEVAMARQDANPLLNLANGQIRRYEQKLYWLESSLDITEWQQAICVDGEVNLPDSLGSLSLKSSSQGQLSLFALQTGQLRVIFNPEGLTAHPVERGHSRKLKKLFQEYKIPSWQRRRMPILMCGDQVVAIANLFIDHRFIGQDCELIWDK